MRVVEPHEFKGVKHPKKKRKPRFGLVFGAAVVLAVCFAFFSTNHQPNSAVKGTQTAHKQNTANTQVAPPVITPARTYHYCVGVRGVSESELPAFAQKIDWTLNMNRGWSLSGKIAYKKVETGCDFTVWLATPANMASFGGICDSEWSCRVGNSVVANYDKWQHASDTWRELEGNIDLYQSMVINHEVGHWFGFEHDHCKGPGQPAPVMQQQSVDLEGCVFNPWPTNEERQVLQKQLNL